MPRDWTPTRTYISSIRCARNACTAAGPWTGPAHSYYLMVLAVLILVYVVFARRRLGIR